MLEDERLMVTLTVKEFMEMNQSLRQDYLATQTEPVKTDKEVRDNIYLEEAALITGYTQKTIYTKVSRREIPIVSAGRPLTFSRIQLNEWIAKGRPSIAEMIADEYLNK
jgi:predicted DNA-binding transcriptional regulator AlpA